MRTVFLRMVGVVLMMAAAPKIRHPDSFQTALHGYRLFPEWSIAPLKVVVPGLEIVLGVALILFLARWATLAAAGLFAGFSVVLGSAWARGLTLTCGCFGRIDRGLHELPYGVLIHLLLNLLVTVGLVLVLRRSWKTKTQEGLC